MHRCWVEAQSLSTALNVVLIHLLGFMWLWFICLTPRSLE
jgi:hypothetical protein